MKRRCPYLTALGVGLLSLSTIGCGGDPEASGGDSQEEVASLEVFSWWIQPGEAEALQALFDLYQDENDGARVFNAAAMSGPTAKEILSERLEAGDPPDLFQQNAYEMRAFEAQHPGVIEPLTDLFAEVDIEDVIPPEVLDNVTVDGDVYSVPVNAHRENSLFYNKQILDDNGIEPPRTLEDFLAACEKLDAAGITPVAVSTSQSWIVSKLFISLAMGSMGAPAFRDYFGGESELDEQAMGDAIDVLDTVLTKYIDTERAAEDGFGWSECAEAVHNGEAAMFLHGDWAKGYFVQLGWTPDVDFGVVGAPGASELFLYGTDVFGIPVGAKHAEEAREFAKTILSVEGQVAFNQIKGSSPIRFDVPLEEFDPLAQQVISDFENADIRMALKWQDGWDAAIGAFASDHDKAALLQAFKDTPPQR